MLDKATVVFIVLYGCLGWPAAAASLAHDSLNRMSVEGEVVDIACFMGRDHKRSHPKCTKSCLLDGTPIGLLGQDESLYLLLEDPQAPQLFQKLKQSPSERVRVEGVVLNAAESRRWPSAVLRGSKHRLEAARSRPSMPFQRASSTVEGREKISRQQEKIQEVQWIIKNDRLSQ